MLYDTVYSLDMDLMYSPYHAPLCRRTEHTSNGETGSVDSDYEDLTFRLQTTSR